ncbi:MAG: sugar ABC transporter permease [Clostridia bacterium]|nr:sugar ABC transporter permease [Clostridia bacterium]MBR4442404.1 sugar ABC transporter permease [Clostridia bacterium]
MANGTTRHLDQHSAWYRIRKCKFLYLLFLPVLVYYIMFAYAPMFGLVIAFKDYNVFKGIWASKWVGFKYFTQFFESRFFFRLIRNTFLISFYGLIFGFPAPIILALLLNEQKDGLFKRAVQTISYLPHFISTVVLVSMFVQFLSVNNGLINNLVEAFGGTRTYFLGDPKYFRTLYTSLGIWRGIGWGSIIYLAALTNVSPELYEACLIDGGGRLRQTWHITLPGISNTIIIMLIFRVGELLSVGSETILLMYNEAIYETADVISTYVYRRGLINAEYSFGAAVGLFNSIIGLILVSTTNALSKRFSETSLW